MGSRFISSLFFFRPNRLEGAHPIGVVGSSLLMALCLTICSPLVAVAEPVAAVKGHTVEYMGRNYNEADNATTFSYEVCRISDSATLAMESLVVGYPACDSPLNVQSAQPLPVTMGVDPNTGVFGVIWSDTIANSGECKTYSMTLAGEVGTGVVNVGLGAGDPDNRIVQLPGASCSSNDQLCSVGTDARIVVMIDQTNSISPQQLELQKAAARTLVTSFAGTSPRPKVAIGTFNVIGGQGAPANARIIAALTDDYGSQGSATTSVSGLYAAIDGILGSSGTTDIEVAIDVAAAELANTGNPDGDPNFIVLISDGVPNRPGMTSYPVCDGCGCDSAFMAGDAAATTAEGAPVNAKIFAVHYDDPVPQCPGADGEGYMRDTIASNPSCFFSGVPSDNGSNDLGAAFQLIADQVVCEDTDACRVFSCVGGGCVSEPLNPNDPDATEGGPCDLDNNEQGLCAVGRYDSNCVCKPVNEPVPEVCDNQLDDDCDGKTDNEDEDCFECLTPGQVETESCDTGLEGVCAGGSRSRECVDGFWTDYSACQGEFLPGDLMEGPDGDPTCMGGEDEDCDGKTDQEDEGCQECVPEQVDTMDCMTDLPGVCKPGEKSRVCGEDGLWGEFTACVSDVNPEDAIDAESIANNNCADQEDNDCDGKVDPEDEGCQECIPGAQETEDCSTENPGVCEPGKRNRVCGEDGFWQPYSACIPNIDPEQAIGGENPDSENCEDQQDNDCDGLTDNEDPDCFECESGMQQEEFCEETGLFGMCSTGKRTRSCEEGFWGEFGECVPTVDPEEEICDMLDNDCDGEVDEGFNVGEPCAIPGEGVCQEGGIVECTEEGVAQCIPSEESSTLTVTGSSEECDGLDNDCDGLVDELAVCLECEDIDIISSQFTVDGNVKTMERLVRRVANKIIRDKRSGSRKKARARLLKAEAKDLADTGWRVVWSLPTVITNCGDTEFCVTVSNVDTINSYVGISNQLRELIRTGVKRLRRIRGNRGGRRFINKGDELHQENEATADVIPATASSCTVP